MSSIVINSSIIEEITIEGITKGSKLATKKAAEAATSTVIKTSGKIVDSVTGYTSSPSDIIRGVFGGSDIAQLVNELVDDSIEDIVSDQMKKFKSSYYKSDANLVLSTAESYYNKILNSDAIMLNMKNDYTTVINKKINSKINDKLFSLQNKLGGRWAAKLIEKSKIYSILTKSINAEVTNLINTIISDKMITQVSDEMIKTVNKIKGAAEAEFQKTFSNEIAYAKKLQKAVEDKIAWFNEQKAKYEAKIMAEVKKLENMINEQVKKIEQAIVNEISKVVKIDAGSFL